MDEVAKIKDRYAKRSSVAGRYNILDAANYLTEEEKERAFIRWIKQENILPLEDKKVLEIGCGEGKNLIQFIRLGFNSANLWGNDLLDERLYSAGKKLPQEVTLIPGDALTAEFKAGFFDIVFQSMVFSSILDKEFQEKLAKKLWELVKPGGGLLWYDFIYDNPNNKDVKGVPYKRIKQLFPVNEISVQKITLAPPLSRIVTKVHPNMYHIFNFFPFFRTHLLCWIKKAK